MDMLGKCTRAVWGCAEVEAATSPAQDSAGRFPWLVREVAPSMEAPPWPREAKLLPKRQLINSLQGSIV